MITSLNWKPQVDISVFWYYIWLPFYTEESIVFEMSVLFCLVILVVIFNFFRCIAAQ